MELPFRGGAWKGEYLVADLRDFLHQNVGSSRAKVAVRYHRIREVIYKKGSPVYPFRIARDKKMFDELNTSKKADPVPFAEVFGEDIDQGGADGVEIDAGGVIEGG